VGCPDRPAAPGGRRAQVLPAIPVPRLDGHVEVVDGPNDVTWGMTSGSLAYSVRRWASSISAERSGPPKYRALAADFAVVITTQKHPQLVNVWSSIATLPDTSGNFSGRVIRRAETKVLGVIHRFVEQTCNVMVVERIHRTSSRTMTSHKAKRAQQTELVRNS
jgi:hypothetical protein